MIWQLMKRDPAWNWMPYFVLASAALCLLWPFLPAGAYRDARSLFFFLAFMAATTERSQQEDTRFQTTLPVTVRQVYVTRILSMLAIVWFPVAVSVPVILALGNPAVSVVTLLESLSFFTLAMAGLQTLGIRGAHGLNIFRVVIWGLAASCMSATADLYVPLVLPLLCWPVIAAIFFRTWQTVPKSFQSAPLNLLSAASRPAATYSNWMPGWMPVLRTIFPLGGLWLMVPFAVMLFGDNRFFLAFFPWLAWQAARPRVRWLFALPVPRGTLLAAILLPVVLAFTGGYLVSIHRPSFPSAFERGVWLQASQEPLWSRHPRIPDCKTLNVLPTLEFWSLAKNGRAPLIEAPWGETFHPQVSRVYGFDIFNPYAVGCGNSERFLDWQFTRATTAVYGRPLPRDKHMDWMEGHVVVTSPRTQFVNIVEIAGIVIATMIVVLMWDWHRFRRFADAAVVTIGWLAAVAGAAVLMVGIFRDWDPAQWLSWVLPESLSTAIVVAIPTLAMLYWLLDTLLGQIELVDKAQSPLA